MLQGSKICSALLGWLFDTDVALRRHHLLNGQGSTVGKLPRWCNEDLGVHRMGQRPGIHASGERWRSFISLVSRLRLSDRISSKPLSSLCSPPITVLPLQSHDLHTWAQAATPRASADVGPLVWDGFRPNPPSAPSTAADSVCLVQRGGGPFVYLSMGWNDRAKLLESAQL